MKEILSNNYSIRTSNTIDRFTPHCVCAQWTAERIAQYFQSIDTASANYCIGYDGSTCVSVPEKFRAWTSGGTKYPGGKSGKMNDMRAITVEIASDMSDPYAMTDKAWEACAGLCVDIMKRRGFTTLVYESDPVKAETRELKPGELLLTLHSFYAYKTCPGAYFVSRIPEFIQRVNDAVSISDKTPAKDYYADAKAFCIESGIFRGDGRGNYGWNEPLTKEQAAQMIYNLHTAGVF